MPFPSCVYVGVGIKKSCMCVCVCVAPSRPRRGQRRWLYGALYWPWNCPQGCPSCVQARSAGIFCSRKFRLTLSAEAVDPLEAINLRSFKDCEQFAQKLSRKIQESPVRVLERSSSRVRYVVGRLLGVDIVQCLLRVRTCSLIVNQHLQR